jgi:anti-sigma B factor antagonist
MMKAGSTSQMSSLMTSDTIQYRILDFSRRGSQCRDAPPRVGEPVERHTSTLDRTAAAASRLPLEAIMPARGDAQEPPLELSYRILPDGEAVICLGGELDIVSADVAIGYVIDVIDQCHVPLAVHLAALQYCDTSGLRALERIADYAELAGCPFRLASPSQPLLKIMRITGLDRRFLASQVPAQAIRK